MTLKGKTVKLSGLKKTRTDSLRQSLNKSLLKSLMIMMDPKTKLIGSESLKTFLMDILVLKSVHSSLFLSLYLSLYPLSSKIPSGKEWTTREKATFQLFSKIVLTLCSHKWLSSLRVFSIMSKTSTSNKNQKI